jgi:hypothetical protein
MEKNKNTGSKELLNFSSESFEDAITYEKVHRHLRDINDTITEEDIKNVRTDFVSNNRNNSGEKEKIVIAEALNDQPSQKDSARIFDEGKKITSSWNILSE